MASEIHEGDIGTKLLITVIDDGNIVDISTATSLSIFIKKPDATLLSKSGILETDGTDGKMHYFTIAGDLDIAGIYKIQGKIIFPSGSYYTSTATFIVNCNL